MRLLRQPWVCPIPPQMEMRDLGFYEGVEDDHGNTLGTGTWIDMNAVELSGVLSYYGDSDVFKIKSQSLADDGTLNIGINRNLFGENIFARLASGATNRLNTLTIHFKDGTFDELSLPGYSLSGRLRVHGHFGNLIFLVSGMSIITASGYSLKKEIMLELEYWEVILFLPITLPTSIKQTS